MLADLPPSSSEHGLRPEPAVAITVRPVAVPPVNETRSTSGWRTSASPVVVPRPQTMFTTPAGTPASVMSSISRATASGVCSAGLTTQQLPKAMQPAIFIEVSANGAFHGPISAATPIGSRVTSVKIARVLSVNLPRILADEFGEEFEIQRCAGDLTQRQVAHRNARIEAFEIRKLGRMLSNERGQPAQDGLALRDIHSRPRSVKEGAARGAHGVIDDRGIGLIHLAHGQFGRGIDDGQRNCPSRRGETCYQ